MKCEFLCCQHAHLNSKQNQNNPRESLPSHVKAGAVMTKLRETPEPHSSCAGEPRGASRSSEDEHLLSQGKALQLHSGAFGCCQGLRELNFYFGLVFPHHTCVRQLRRSDFQGDFLRVFFPSLAIQDYFSDNLLIKGSTVISGTELGCNSLS